MSKCRKLGNEVDGYREITKVVDLATGKEIDRFKWYEKVASYADDYSA